eukprot:96045-Heterocapsa_arctica.AAC.1
MVRTRGTEDLPAHLAPRWQAGLYLGRRADSDEHLVITSDVIRASRAVRAVENVDEQLVNDIFGQSGRVQPSLEKVEKSEELEKAEKSKRSAESSNKIQEALASAPRTGMKRQYQTLEYRDELKRYREQVGPTEGCTACQLGGAKRHHSYACKVRKLEWLEQDRKRGEEG